MYEKEVDFGTNRGEAEKLGKDISLSRSHQERQLNIQAFFDNIYIYIF